MAEVKLIQDMADFLEFNQLMHLIQDQMEYIGAPKTNEEIMNTFKLAIESEHAQLIALSDNGYPVGFIFFNVNIGMESAGKYVWLNEMHVHREYRGKGYGTLLFQALENWCKEQNIVRIIGMADNSEERTLHFYQNQGCKTYPQQIFSIHLK